MKKTSLLIVLLLSGVFASAQSYLSLYNFDHINQNLMVNPASSNPYKFVIGIPGLSNFNTYVNSSSSWSSIFESGSDANNKFESTLNSLNGNERINLSQNLDVLFVGFATKNGYFSLGAQEVIDFNMTFPGELIKFLYYGNVGSGYFGNTLSLNDFDLSVTSRINYHIGYQHRIDSNLTIGGRYKYISGIANMNTSNFKAEVYTDVDKIEITTDILLQTSGLGLTSSLSSTDIVDIVSAKNSGMAFDLGASYRINDWWDVSASVLDIGWINWNKDLKGFESKGTFEYTGVEFEYVPGDSTNFEDQLATMFDSLQSKLDFKETNISSYKTTLPTHFMASTQVYATPKHLFGLVYHGTLWNSKMYHSYGVQYVGKWHKMINFMAGYSVVDQIRNNLSLGLSVRLGFFQLYAMTDNVFGIIEPSNISATSVRAGINLSFYKKPKILTEN